MNSKEPKEDDTCTHVGTIKYQDPCTVNIEICTYPKVLPQEFFDELKELLNKHTK